VVPPGLDLEALERPPLEREAPPLIIWNHRWEFDKQPEVFFDALAELDRDGVPFRLALLGENSRSEARSFLDARRRYGPRLVHFGYEPDRAQYLAWLRRGAVSVSTAAQENFGIAAVEAAYAGAAPLWPDRLSYPELLGPAAGRDHLYADFRELVVKLKARALEPIYDQDRHQKHKEELGRFDWSRLIERYDDLIERTAQKHGP
jgi:glycosyltransferase involved in cell wall biosynthesis